MHPLSREKVAGCSSARLECLLWEQEVVSSNLAIPTNQKEATQMSGFFVVSYRYDWLVVTEWCRWRWLAEGLLNDAAADDKTVLVHHQRLAWSNSPNGSCEHYMAISRGVKRGRNNSSFYRGRLVADTSQHRWRFL